MLQLGHALAVRSERDSLWSLGPLSNLPLLLAVGGTVALQLVVVYWGPVQDLFSTEALDLFELGVVLVASTVVFWVVEVEKAWRRRRAGDSAGA
jgi:Ca2+-transporting ATPase